MISKYDCDNLLSLSGIQHFAYCPRQWALIHIEKQWVENLLTFEGKQLHERVNNPNLFESRGNILTARSVPLCSYTLGFYGISDLVEFLSVKEKGVVLKGYKGEWQPIPIEYKRGKPKRDNIDKVQLCAQAICLEEMLNANIRYGYLFYGQTRHRIKILFNIELRNEVKRLSWEMHRLFDKQITPKALKNGKSCKFCSFYDICIPKLTKKRLSVKSYIEEYLK
jgi:CRISPR-associated exonuclease Cas4